LAWCSARSSRARPLRPRCIRTASAEHPAPRASRLARTLFFVYVLLVAYASLYPFSGWRDVGLSPLAFLNGPWPRYVTAFDITVNVAGYLPFGLLAVLAIYPRLAPTAAALLAVAAAAALSLLLEAAQSYLPARVPTNLDVLCNIGGAALGAALAQHFAVLIGGGPLSRQRAAALLPGPDVDFGLVVLGLWFFVQLNPAVLLFGSGDLRDLLAPFDGRARRPQFFVVIEAVTTAANLIAVALILSALVAPGRPVRAMIMLMMLAALSVKTAAVAILMRAENVFTWLTHGAQIGLAVGIAGALAAVALPRTARLVLAAVLLMAATVLVNLAPPNPYLADSLKVWQQGHFLNFNGLTRLVSALWPFIALGYLMVLASRRLK
jgi:VanZ family protein